VKQRTNTLLAGGQNVTEYYEFFLYGAIFAAVITTALLIIMNRGQ